jgi:chemotaxis regulatin CheY-phosphate phosphatase CheZ
MEYPKRIKRELRELAGQAHENEMGRELEQLARHFDEWHEGKIDAASLTELIHQYHNGPTRELWKKYNSGFVEVLVAQAIVNGILQREQVTEETWPYIEEAIEKYKLISR